MSCKEEKGSIKAIYITNYDAGAEGKITALPLDELPPPEPVGVLEQAVTIRINGEMSRREFAKWRAGILDEKCDPPAGENPVNTGF